MKFPFAILLLVAPILVGSGQKDPQVVVPTFDDDYCKQVAELEAGNTDINYQAFRFSFLESEQFKVASEKRSVFRELEKKMYEQMKKKKYEDIISTTKKMLSIDYTSMRAHKILRQTYKILGDTTNAAKYKTIQFGLLNSIVKNGDGKSCPSAWPVIQITEEYFILEMIEATLQSQRIENDEGLCDRMDVIEDKEERTYYFETSKVFLGYKKLGLE